MSDTDIPLSFTPPNAAKDIVHVYHAGSLISLMGDIGPAFTAATGYPFKIYRGPSVGLANQINSGEINPDVYMTADAETNYLLMGHEHGNHVQWFFIMARQCMVLAYSPKSKFKAEFEAVDQKKWYEILESPGLLFGRSDPQTDPGGYRVVFVLQLAEKYYRVPGPKERILQGDNSEQQIALYDINKLKDGSVDAIITYSTSVKDAGLPYLQFPDEVNQSNPDMKSIYASASYTNPQGQTFHGTPALYGVTVPAAAKNPAGAAAFIQYLLSESGRASLTKHGFLPAPVLLGGEQNADPASFRAHIAVPYTR